MVTSSNFSTMISLAISTRSLAIRTISCCLSRMREEPYCVFNCCAPSVSCGSVAPRMMSLKPHDLINILDDLFAQRHQRGDG